MKAVATGVLVGLPAVGAYESILGVDLPRFSGRLVLGI